MFSRPFESQYDTNSDPDDNINIEESKAYYDNTVFQSSLLQHVTNYLQKLNTTTTATTATTATTTTNNTNGDMMYPLHTTMERLNLSTTQYIFLNGTTTSSSRNRIGTNTSPRFPDEETVPFWLQPTTTTNESTITTDLLQQQSSMDKTSSMETTTTTSSFTITNGVTMATSTSTTGSTIDSSANHIPSSSTTTAGTTTSFMIAIPMLTPMMMMITTNSTNENNHPTTTTTTTITTTTTTMQQQLSTEIESIQRAITYHCPILQSACIATTTSSSSSSSLRIPLLSVTIQPFADTNDNHDDYITIIQQFVQQAIHDTLHFHNNHENTKYYVPLTVSIAKLGIDGYNNSHGDDGTTTTATTRNDDTPLRHSEHEVLYTVIDEPFVRTTTMDDETNGIVSTTSSSSSLSNHNNNIQQLCTIVDTIYSSIQTRYPTWSIQRAWDDHGHMETHPTTMRLPIMRLPTNYWKEIVGSSSQQSPEFLTSDQGGNGISPIFWILYSSDIFMHEYILSQIAIYPNVDQNQISSPSISVAKNQQQHHADDDDMDDALHPRSIWSETNYPYIAASVSLLERTSWHSTMTDIALERSLVQNDGVDDANGNRPILLDSLEDTNVDQQERMKNIIASRVQKPFQQKRTIKVPSDRNPIFEKYRNGTLVIPPTNNALTTSASSTIAPPHPLKPFPNRDAAVGFWSMIRSPTGFATDNNAVLSDNPTTSDNLILRVDGTIAGGPILDPIARHKAAGGSWRYIENNKESDNDEDSNNMNPIKNASLQIRFIIPPKKDRVLVMEGQFKKLSTLPEHESLDSNNTMPFNDNDATYICNGNVWIEDAKMTTPSFFTTTTTTCRDEIGTFTIVKILNNSPMERNRQLTITIPKNVRYID